MSRYQSNHLAEILEAQGRRKDWLAAMAGVSPALVAMVLSGERTVSEDIARRISVALGVPLFLAFELHNGRKLRLDGNGKAA